MFPPPQDVPDEDKGTDTEYVENYLLPKTPSSMKFIELRHWKSIFAFASSEGIKKEHGETNNKEKTNDDMEAGLSKQRDKDTNDSSKGDISPKKK